MLPRTLASIVLALFIAPSAYGIPTNPDFSKEGNSESREQPVRARVAELRRLFEEHPALFTKMCDITVQGECGDVYQCNTVANARLALIVYVERTEVLEWAELDLGAGEALYRMRYVDPSNTGIVVNIVYDEIHILSGTVADPVARRVATEEGLASRRALIQYRYAAGVENLIGCITKEIR